MTAKHQPQMCLHKCSQRGENKRTQRNKVFIQEYELVCEVSYRGSCCTEPWQLVKFGTEKSHQPACWRDVTLPRPQSSPWIPAKSFPGYALQQCRGTCSGEPSPVQSASSVWSCEMKAGGCRLNCLRSSQYFATGNCTYHDVALSQQLNQWYFIILK